MTFTLILVASGCAIAQSTDPVWVPGSSQKICQLTGETDYETGQPTVSQTESRYGLHRADVGYSFEHKGQIWFLFGDATPTPTFNGQANGSPPRKVAYDSPGFTAGTDITQCLKLDFPKNSIGSYVNPVIVDNQGKEVVPLGVDEYLVVGIDLGGRMFVVGATDNDVVNPTPGNLGQPTRTVMAVSDDNGQTYHYLYDVSTPPCPRCDGAKFVNLALGMGTDGYLCFFGTQGGTTSDMSAVFLARKTAITLATAGGFQYLTGLAKDGTPNWSSSEADAAGMFQDFNGNPPVPANCARQLGVEYNSFVQRWAMLYTCSNVTTSNLSGFYLRFASQPWGPWGAPQTIFNAQRDRGICRFIHRVPSATEPPCDNLSDPDRISTPGTHYAPFFISRFTSGSSADSTSTFYYTLATFNPYTQVVMKLTVQAAGSTAPVIGLVANAEGENDTIAPNTWLEVKGLNLAPPSDAKGRTWGTSDFVNGQMPAALDGVSATVNGKAAFIYYVSPTQVNILTPPDAISGPVQIQISNNGAMATYTSPAQTLSPSLFVFSGGNVAAVHLDGTLVGPTTLYPGRSTPAKPGETVVLYANGFGPTSAAVVSGSATQSGTLSTLPVVSIGGVSANVTFAGLVAPGEFQFNVTMPWGWQTGFSRSQ